MGMSVGSEFEDENGGVISKLVRDVIEVYSEGMPGMLDFYCR
jgi:hypothetical protein